MFRPIITPENEEKLRTIYQKEGYMSKATNIALKEFFQNHTQKEILKQIQEVKTQ